jgi:hypothetical protein
LDQAGKPLVNKKRSSSIKKKKTSKIKVVDTKENSKPKLMLSTDNALPPYPYLEPNAKQTNQKDHKYPNKQKPIKKRSISL